MKGGKGRKYQRATSYKNYAKTCATLLISNIQERRKTLDKRNKNSEI